MLFIVSETFLYLNQRLERDNLAQTRKMMSGTFFPNIEIEKHQGALLSTMNTTGPATRPAHSFYKLRTRPLDPVATRLRFLGGDYPANPLIARKRRNIIPCCSCRRGRSKGLS